ncbi:MAG: biotin-independent malonate decarboxylase subunit gamma [Betaproteobacteria bacterium]
MHSPRPTTPHAWLRALADDSAFDEHEARSPSPHLARYGIAPQDDDGIVAATVNIGGRVFEAVAQDAQFLRGSVGERHGAKLAAAIARARSSRRPLLVLAASGGVRLHEANAGELALARALRALVDARAEGIATLAIGIGDVFGGMSVVVTACDALALLPGTRFGLSGPRVIALAQGGATAAGAHEERASLDAVFGAAARAKAAFADALDDDVHAMRAWIGRRLAPPAFAASVLAAQARLASATGGAAANVAVTRDGARATLAAFARSVDAASLVGVDAALLALPHGVRTLLIVEDSRGHDASIAAERIGVSRYFAHHACVLGLLRARGMALIGVVDGVGHSAAFFANALQADRVYALPGSRVVAMEPRALARVTGMDAAMLARAIDDDPLLGHPARHLAALGGLTLVETIDAAR